jgi:hypothetical protein
MGMTKSKREVAREIMAMVERMDREAEIERRVEAEVERRLAEKAAQDEQAKINGLRRSQMTPLEKSSLIRSRGKPWYDALPW